MCTASWKINGKHSDGASVVYWYKSGVENRFKSPFILKVAVCSSTWVKYIDVNDQVRNEHDQVHNVTDRAHNTCFAPCSGGAAVGQAQTSVQEVLTVMRLRAPVWVACRVLSQVSDGIGPHSEFDHVWCTAFVGVFCVCRKRVYALRCSLHICVLNLKCWCLYMCVILCTCVRAYTTIFLCIF